MLNLILTKIIKITLLEIFVRFYNKKKPFIILKKKD